MAPTPTTIHPTTDRQRIVWLPPDPDPLTLGDIQHLVGRLHPDGCATCNRLGPDLIASWAAGRGRA